MAWRLCFSHEGYDKYKAIATKFKKEILNYQEKEKIIKRSDMNKFYNYVNKELKHKPKIAPIRKLDNSFTNLDEEKCNILIIVLQMFTVDDDHNPTC